MNGEQEGLETVWNKSGEKKSESHWENGKQEGLETTWYGSGEKKSEGYYVNGVKL